MTLEAFLRQFGASLGDGALIAFVVALAAGLVASAVCPCTLPVGLGVASVAGASEQQSRKAGVLIALAFFVGIVVNLTLLGAIASRLGALGTEAFGRYWSLAMALLSLAAGVLAFAGPRLSTKRLAALRRPGIGGAFSYGFVFSLGTAAAPLLLLLTVAASQGRPAVGIMLAFAFGVGRGLPFLVVGVFASFLTRFVRLAEARPALQIISGIVLIFVSLYYLRAFVTLL